MKRKAAALLTAVLVMAMGSMTVLAADSPSTGDIPSTPGAGTTAPETPQLPSNVEKVKEETTVKVSDVKLDEGLTLKSEEEPSKETLREVAAALTNELADLKNLSKKLDNEALKAAAEDDSYEVKTEILTVLDLDGEEGYHEIEVPGIEKGEGIVYVLLHETNGEWKLVPAEVTADGKIKAYFTGFSKYAIVKLDTEPKTKTEPEEPEEPEKGYGWPPFGSLFFPNGYHPGAINIPDSTAGGSAGSAPAGTDTAASASSSASSAAADGTSPKTGAEFPAAAVMAVICLAGVAVCRKKVNFS